MSLFELLCLGERFNRRGLRLPLLLGRLHLGLIFSGPSSSSCRKCSDSSSLRSFLFIAAILITKCGSSSFSNKQNLSENSVSAIGSAMSSTPTSTMLSVKQLDGDLQDYPMEYHKFTNTKSMIHDPSDNPLIGHTQNSSPYVRTVGYYLKGLILPMLISVTLSFGFIIFKNRMKRARLQAIQNSVEEARANPNFLQTQNSDRGFTYTPASAIPPDPLSVQLRYIEARRQWQMLRRNQGSLLEPDDYVGEGGETARHKPYHYDLPPDYATVFAPPTYEEAIAGKPALKKNISTESEESGEESEQMVQHYHDYAPGFDEGKHLMAHDSD